MQPVLLGLAPEHHVNETVVLLIAGGLWQWTKICINCITLIKLNSVDMSMHYVHKVNIMYSTSHKFGHIF